MWAGYDCFLTAYRDVLGLQLPEHDKYKYWEDAAIHGGFRIMHEEFCIVSDFPEFIHIDEQNRAHCETGPSHRWRDGWSIYTWHGVAVPARWIENRKNLTAAEVLRVENMEQRRAGCEILGWAAILDQLKAVMIDKDTDPHIGELLEVTLPDSDEPDRFVRARCGTGREFAICVPRTMKTALQAQAWMHDIPENEFTRPEVRT
jgi:hypothetical protein